MNINVIKYAVFFSKPGKILTIKYTKKKDVLSSHYIHPTALELLVFIQQPLQVDHKVTRYSKRQSM